VTCEAQGWLPILKVSAYTQPEQWTAILVRHPGSDWGLGAFLKVISYQY